MHESVESRVDRLLGLTSARLGESARRVEGKGASGRTTPSEALDTPGTVNPLANELRYTPAGEFKAYSDSMSRGSPSGDENGASVDPSTMLSLGGALRAAQAGGREFKSAEEDYILAAISLLIERHLWGPRFFNDTSAELSGTGTGGDFQNAVGVVNRLRMTKRLPFGGEVEASWVFRASEQLRRQATGRYTQSSSLVLSGSVPLLRGFGSVAREDLIQAERTLVYRARSFERFRRTYLVDIATDFFDLKQAQASIANLERQLEALKRLETSTQARVEAGRLDAFQTSIATSRVLAAQASLRGQRETYRLRLDRFKVRLGLAPEAAVRIAEIDLDIPDPVLDEDAATRAALEYRLDLQNSRDQVLDAQRSVANARDAVRPDLSLDASVEIPSDPSERVGLSPSGDDANYTLGATFSLPLDRETERLGVRQAEIRLAQQERSYEQSRDTVIVSVRAATRSIDVARFQLQLAEQQVEINRRRLQGQQLKADSVDPQTLVDSLNELLDAENNRDRAQTDLRTAILNYLLESDQLRVSREGTMERLPGMDDAPAKGP
ncbi:MAG: TolC family protein [Phycisphaerales bacterium]|nr:MAG: TolC family protein [Phycisphaerales bacterium]